MPNRRKAPATDAERQLTWSKNYLKREKRRRLLRRIVFIAILAALCGMAVFAATGGEFSAWPTAGPAPSAPASTPAPAVTPPADDPAEPPAPVQPASFTVTFDSRGGSDVAAREDVAQGALLAAPDEPTREGYLFSGWYADDARTRIWDFAADTVEQDLTLYAGWQAAPEEEVAAMPQTGVSSGTLLWACVLAAALALAALVALLLRRAYREGDRF